VSALVLSLIAALGYGVSDFVGGLAARRTAVLRVVMLSYPVGFVVMLAVAPLVGGTVTTRSLLVGAAAGLVSGCAIVWFYAALASGPMSVVSPLTSLLVAGLPLGVGILWGERPGPLALVGAVLAVVAVVLVSRQESTAVDESPPIRFTPKVAWLTFGSGAAFAVYFVLLDQVGPGTGLWPLVTSRASASALVLVAGLVAGHRRPPTGPTMWLALAAAALDILANTTFLYALRGGMLSIVSVLTSLYPAGTLLLAWLVLKERAGVLQRVGLILAAAAVVLIAGAPVTG
jgi:drug/metabolite transporter (DMT)-like permease